MKYLFALSTFVIVVIMGLLNKSENAIVTSTRVDSLYKEKLCQHRELSDSIKTNIITLDSLSKIKKK